MEQLQGQNTATCTGRDHIPPGLSPHGPRRPCRSLRQRDSSAFCSAAAVSSPPQVQATSSPDSQPRDAWIARSLAALGWTEGVSERLQGLRETSRQALQTLRMPTSRSEEYRFTDIRPILALQPAVSTVLGTLPVPPPRLEGGSSAWVLNGRVAGVEREGLPPGVYLGPVQGAPASALQELGQQSHVRGSPFAVMNGALVRDALVLVVPEGVAVPEPVHVRYSHAGGSDASATASAPRLLCVLGRGAQARVLEEFVGDQQGAPHFVNAVAEFCLGEEASLEHGYVSVGGGAPLQMKASLVRQAARSRYALTEARTGAALTRHDLSIAQEGPETDTGMQSFLLAGEGQVHDLHSSLRLTHPRGTASQLHKCIVASPTGRGVFDGRVKVERAAQQTDAKQLSRNLLLAPRASVNVKPSLQIIADDVKCTHGAAVSDLEESQLFYFRSRGIDAATARRVLVYSFGAEVTSSLPREVRERIQAAVDATLASVKLDTAEEPA